MSITETKIEMKCLRALNAKKNTPLEIKNKKMSFHNNECFIYNWIEDMIDYEHYKYTNNQAKKNNNA